MGRRGGNPDTRSVSELLKAAEHEIVVAKRSTDRPGMHAAYALNLIEAAVEKSTTRKEVERAWRVLKKIAKANVMIDDQAGRYHVVETGIRNAMKRYTENPSRKRNHEDEDITDDPRYDDVKEAITAYVEQQADIDAAANLSYVDDQTQIDLEAQGYDPESIISIGAFGDQEAVNGDVLVSPFWEKELGIKKDVRHPVVWGEASFTTQLGKWLERNGYEKTDRGGAWPGGMETEIDVDAMTDHLAGTTADRKFIKAVVEYMAKSRDLSTDKTNETIYASSGNGGSSIYAKPMASKNPHRGKAKRSGKKRRAKRSRNPRERQIAARLARAQ